MKVGLINTPEDGKDLVIASSARFLPVKYLTKELWYRREARAHRQRRRYTSLPATKVQRYMLYMSAKKDITREQMVSLLSCWSEW